MLVAIIVTFFPTPNCRVRGGFQVHVILVTWTSLLELRSRINQKRSMCLCSKGNSEAVWEQSNEYYMKSFWTEQQLKPPNYWRRCYSLVWIMKYSLSIRFLKVATFLERQLMIEQYSIRSPRWSVCVLVQLKLSAMSRTGWVNKGTRLIVTVVVLW